MSMFITDGTRQVVPKSAIPDQPVPGIIQPPPPPDPPNPNFNKRNYV